MSWQECYPLPEGILKLSFSSLKLCPWAPLLIPETPHIRTKKNRLYMLTAEEEGEEVRILSIFGEWHCPLRRAPLLLTHLLNRIIARLLPPGTLHAALVGKPDRALLLVGKSGTGKTTLTLSLIEQGFLLGSDEFVTLTPDGIAAFPRALEYEGNVPTPLGETYEFAEYEYKLWRCLAPPLLLSPFSALRAVIYLEPDRAGPYLIPLSRLPLTVWIHLPRWSQFPDLFRFYRLPLFSLYPGEVVETLSVLTRLLA